MATSPPLPDSEVPAKATRRRFTAAEKARILDAYEAASPIERAAICRRDSIYSSLLTNWRKQSVAGKPLASRRRNASSFLRPVLQKNAMPQWAQAG